MISQHFLFYITLYFSCCGMPRYPVAWLALPASASGRTSRKGKTAAAGIASNGEGELWGSRRVRDYKNQGLKNILTALFLLSSAGSDFDLLTWFRLKEIASLALKTSCILTFCLKIRFCYSYTEQL